MQPKFQTLATIVLAFAAPCAGAAQPEPRGRLMPGSYECWNFNRPQMGLNFKLAEGGKYRDTENKAGSYTYDAATGKLAFKGGALDGQTTVYETPKGKPKVSFRNSHGNEIAFCELASR